MACGAESNMDSTVTPITAKERIYTLDVIRGFALLGIFIMNMPWFNTSFYADMTGTELWPERWDKWTETATEVLFSGKFNSMFSMLFAIGFTIKLERLEARDPQSTCGASSGYSCSAPSTCACSGPAMCCTFTR